MSLWKSTVIFSAFVLGLPAAQAQKTKIAELALRSGFNTSTLPLSTEKVWKLDSAELNPHRQRWVLEKDVALVGLRAVAKGKKAATQFGVAADGIKADTILHLRGSGPWYRGISEFSCKPNPDEWFATEEGSRAAGKFAAENWDNALNAARIRLAVHLNKLSAPSEVEAISRAKTIFQNWLAEVNLDWHSRGKAAIRQWEWNFYLKQAQAAHLCKKVPGHSVSWAEMMEPPTGVVPKKMLGRAPARRWNGMFSVRASLTVGTVTLNGQFLVDSSSARSIVSPLWLMNQGVNPAFVELIGSPPERVSWSGGVGIARKVVAFDAVVSGVTVPIQEFLLMDTERFGGPDFLSSCCDGVLGADFLRLFAVEFRPGPPAEIILWPREGYRQPDDTPWVETASTVRGDLVSSCLVTANKETNIPGVNWNTGLEPALAIHRPWQSRDDATKSWDVWCRNFQVAAGISVSSNKNVPALLTDKIPGADIGLGLLGRGAFTFDLGHGRLWFSKPSLSLPIPRNETGLVLDFELSRKKDRKLVVKSIDRKRPAGTLFDAGLRPGMEIVQMDSVPVEELDLWQVEQRLQGIIGKEVVLQWKNRDGSLKLVSLQLVR